ncbi:MAG: hypothetical protein EOM24_14175 [Chloroflexia bacterium]|nr:hypothetical protein [Chloroflexia bacterium]
MASPHLRLGEQGRSSEGSLFQLAGTARPRVRARRRRALTAAPCHRGYGTPPKDRPAPRYPTGMDGPPRPV